jgi:hypothetical protein
MRRGLLFSCFVVILCVTTVLRPVQAKDAREGTSQQIKSIANETLGVVRDIVPALIGNPGAMTKGFDDNVQLTTQAPTSIVDYFERVYWPRLIALMQKQKAQDAEVAALQMSANTSLADAKNASDQAQAYRYQSADTAIKTAKRVDVACEQASRDSSAAANEIIVAEQMRRTTQKNIAKMNGSSDFPETANGVVHYYRESIEARQAAGYGNPKENNGAAAVLYDNFVGPALIDADMNPESLLQSKILLNARKEDGTSLLSPSNILAAEAFIDNLFKASIIFTPLRKEQLKKPLSNQVSEVLSDRVNLTTQIQMLRRPFQMAYAKRQAIVGTDPKIIDTFKAVLKGMGVTEQNAPDIASLFFVEGQMSQDSMDEIRYKTRNLDPKLTSELAEFSAMNDGNTLFFIAQKQMHNIALLYDIREEQRETNRLLGAIGGLLASDRNDSIEAKTRAIASQ